MNAIHEDQPFRTTDYAPEVRDGEEMFRRHYRFIAMLARNCLEYAAATDHTFGADDLAQEISAKAFRIRGTYQPERGKLTTWLSWVARSTVKDIRIHLRRPKRFAGRRCRSLSELPTHPTTAAEEYASDFWFAVSRFVAPHELRALTMRFEEDAELEDIGAVVAPGATNKRSRQSRASRILADAIQKLRTHRFELLRSLGAESRAG